MRTFFFIVLMVAGPMIAWAQEPARPEGSGHSGGEQDGVTWDGSASLSYTEASGNLVTRTLGTGFSVSRTSDLYRWSSDGSLLYSSKSTGVIRKSGIDTTFERELTEHLGLFGRGEYLNRSSGAFSERTVAEGGVRWYGIKQEDREFALAGAAGRTFRRLLPGAPMDHFTHASMRLNWMADVGAITFSQEIGFLEHLGALSDWRTSVHSDVSVAIAEHFAFKVSHHYSYAREPALGRRSADRTLLISLVATWDEES